MFQFEQWRRLTVKDQDPTFVGDFMGVSMDILSRSWQLEHAITQMHSDNNNAHFSIIPKKIKVVCCLDMRFVLFQKITVTTFRIFTINFPMIGTKQINHTADDTHQC